MVAKKSGNIEVKEIMYFEKPEGFWGRLSLI